MAPRSSSPVRAPGQGARPARFGSLLGILLTYHALVLAGGGSIVIGLATSRPVLELVGVPLLAAGVAVQLGVIVWSVRRPNDRAMPVSTSSDPERSARGPLSLTARLCTSCGWGGPGPLLCPRCHRVTVPVAPGGRA